MINMYRIAAFGNPLLDIVVKISDNELLQKYNFEVDSNIDIPAVQIKLLFNDIAKMPNHISPGGCAQNTMRVLQWLLQEKNSIVFFGAIGKDEQGDMLTKLVQNDGVTTKYLIHEDKQTGTCICLARGSKRTLIACLEAAEHFDVSSVQNNPEIQQVLKTVPIVYLESFFLIKRVNTAHYIKELCIKNDRILAFNLCGSYVFETCGSDVVEFAKSCDILFGNRNEFVALGKLIGVNNPESLALIMNRSYSRRKNVQPNSCQCFHKIIVMTNGPDYVYCVFDKEEVIKVDVTKIAPDKIGDTVAAGDAFAAGFLAGLMRDFSIKRCVQLGCWAAGQIVQQLGCTIPDFTPDIYEIL